MQSSLPLKGVRVLDMSTYVAAPVCGRLMADWGADVIKVENLSGDPWRSGGLFYSCPYNDEENPVYELENQNKCHISLNLKTPAGKEILAKLLEDTDIFITNSRSDALQRLNLTYEELAPHYPKLIWAQVQGFGEKGPECHRPGYDVAAFWSRSGILLDFCHKGSPPLNSPAGVGDRITGSILTAGVLAALVKQRATGIGDKVVVSLFSSAIWHAATVITATQDKYGDQYPREGDRPGSPFIATYLCKDGEWLFLSILEQERYWPTLCKIINREDMIRNEQYFKKEYLTQNSTMIYRFLAEIFVTKTSAEWSELLLANDIAFEKVAHFKDVSKDKQAWANDYLQYFTYRNGETAVLPSNPIKYKNCVAKNARQSGPLGADTDEVLVRLGYTPEQIKELEKAAIIKRP